PTRYTPAPTMVCSKVSMRQQAGRQQISECRQRTFLLLQLIREPRARYTQVDREEYSRAPTVEKAGRAPTFRRTTPLLSWPLTHKTRAPYTPEVPEQYSRAPIQEQPGRRQVPGCRAIRIG